MGETTFFGPQKGAAKNAPAVLLFGFGKHPAWSEHRLGVGKSSEGLLRWRDRLYFEGIQEKLEKEWKEKVDDKGATRCEWNHWLFSSSPACCYLGRIVSSVDASGRPHPFIFLTEVSGFPAQLVLRRLVPALDDFAQRCREFKDGKAVEAAFLNEPGTMESLLSQAETENASLLPSGSERAAFAAISDWDSQGVALGRLLYKVESSWAAFAALPDNKAPRPQAGVALRVPALPGQMAASVLLWEEFARSLVHRDVPRSYFVPAAHDWLDLVVGEVEAKHFRGLQMGRKLLGLETEVPHDIGQELQTQAQALMAAWRAGAPLPMPDRPVPAEAGDTATRFFVKSETLKDSIPRPATTHLAKATPSTQTRKPILAAVGVLVVALLALAAWLLLRSPKSVGEAPSPTRIAEHPATTEAAVAPQIAPPELPPSLSVGGDEQVVALGLTVQTQKVSFANLNVQATVKPPGVIEARANYTAKGAWQLVLKPLAEGTAAVTVQAKDERGLQSQPASFEVTVLPKPTPPDIGKLGQIPSLQEGQAAATLELPINAQFPLVSLAKMTIHCTVEPQDVVGVSTRYADGSWQLLLTPKQGGQASVSVSATDERGLCSQTKSFFVTVKPQPVAPSLGAVQVPLLEVGGPAQTLVLPVKVQSPWVSLAKANLQLSSDRPDVVDARASLVNGGWQLVLTPLKEGTAQLTVTATDERGLASRPMGFPVTVNPKPKPPLIDGLDGVPALEVGKDRVVPLAVTVQAPMVSLAKLNLDSKVDPQDIANARVSFEGGNWQLVLTPLKEGTAKVTLTAADERGLTSQPAVIAITVTKPPAPPGQPTANSAQAAATPAPDQQQQLLVQLEAFSIWFGLTRKPGSSILNPPNYVDEGKPARLIDYQLDISQRRMYRERAVELQEKFKVAMLLTPEREITFRNLLERIQRWP